MTVDGSVWEALLGLSRLSDEARVLELLVTLGCELVGADEGSLLLLDEADESLVFALTTSAAEADLSGQRVPLGEGITGLAAVTGEVQIGAPTYDPTGDRVAPTTPGAPEAVLAAPMLVGDTLVGALTAVSFVDGKRFDAEDARRYGMFAAIAALVVHQRQLLSARSTGADHDLAATLAPLSQADGAQREALADLLDAAVRLAGLRSDG